MQPWFIASFFDIGHTCYGQLTPVKTRCPLTIMAGSSLELIEVTWFLEVGRWPSTGLILDRGLMSSDKRGRVLRRPVTANQE